MEPDHIKIYAGGLERIQNLPPNLRGLLFEMLSRATPAECGLTVLMISTIKVQLSKNLGVTGAALNLQLRELEELELIRLKTRNLYEINPWLFGKGDWMYVSCLRKTWEVIGL